MKLNYSLAIVVLLIAVSVKSQSIINDSLGDLLNMHSKNDTHRVDLLNNMAYAIRKKQIEKVFDYANEARIISDSINYKKGYAESYRMIAMGFYEKWDYPNSLLNLDKSFQLFREIEDSISISKVYLDYGNTYYWAEDYQKAMHYYNLAYHLNDKLNNSLEKGYCNYCFALVYRKLHDYDKMIENFDYALTNAAENKNYLRLSVYYNNMGGVYHSLGNYNKALDYYLKSIDLKLEHSDDYGLNHSYSNIGEVYGTIGDIDKAIDYYERGIAIGEERNDYRAVANSYLDLGSLYMRIDSLETALMFCGKALDISKEVEFMSCVTKSYKSLGIIYNKSGDKKKAIENFNLAMNIAEALSLKDQRSAICIELAKMNWTEKNYDKAYSFSKRAHVLALETSEAELIKTSAKLLAESSNKIGKPQEAYNAYVTYKTMYDSLDNVEFLGKIKSLEYKQQYEKEKLVMEHEIQQQNSTIEKRQQQAFLSIAILVLVLLLGAFGMYDYKQLKLKNKILFAKNLKLTKVEQVENKKIIEGIKEQQGITKVKENIGSNLLYELQLVLLDQKLFTNNKLTLEMLAEMLGTNRTYLSRLINQEYACNFNKFINRYRIKEARALLADSDYQNYTIEGIANEVGFNSKSAFNAAFKEHTGIPPSYYKAEALKELQV